MQQTADWLEKVGMAEYAQRFAENDIDFAILGDLTDQDLEKIGVASLGHRRKLLRAIAARQGASAAAPPVTALPAAVPIPSVAPCESRSFRCDVRHRPRLARVQDFRSCRSNGYR